MPQNLLLRRLAEDVPAEVVGVDPGGAGGACGGVGLVVDADYGGFWMVGMGAPAFICLSVPSSVSAAGAVYC